MTTRFYPFRRLPPELRHMIWESTFEPQVHNVIGGSQIGPFDLASPPLATILSVNQESRDTALRVGVLIPRTGYCHKTLDIVHVSELFQLADWNPDDIPFPNVSLEFWFTLGMRLPALDTFVWPYHYSLPSSIARLTDIASRRINIQILLHDRTSAHPMACIRSPRLSHFPIVVEHVEVDQSEQGTDRDDTSTNDSAGDEDDGDTRLSMRDLARPWVQELYTGLTDSGDGIRDRLPRLYLIRPTDCQCV